MEQNSKHLNFMVEEKLYGDYKKVLIDKKKTVSEDLRDHITKVVADSKKPTVY